MRKKTSALYKWGLKSEKNGLKEKIDLDLVPSGLDRHCIKDAERVFLRVELYLGPKN